MRRRRYDQRAWDSPVPDADTVTAIDETGLGGIKTRPVPARQAETPDGVGAAPARAPSRRENGTSPYAHRRTGGIVPGAPSG
ncbi:protein of unknown function [Streptantibioticus cattleyicolor NRRL 8057 = DSM 46488]|nr:protein of unknown function [Streptantibioticus cattleyicolor NRRL 8057 = DSM 46488]